jgi:hypothetical protein
VSEIEWYEDRSVGGISVKSDFFRRVPRKSRSGGKMGREGREVTVPS